jgi:hypothetical protein
MIESRIEENKKIESDYLKPVFGNRASVNQ